MFFVGDGSAGLFGVWLMGGLVIGGKHPHGFEYAVGHEDRHVVADGERFDVVRAARPNSITQTQPHDPIENESSFMTVQSYWHTVCITDCSPQCRPLAGESIMKKEKRVVVITKSKKTKTRGLDVTMPLI